MQVRYFRANEANIRGLFLHSVKNERSSFDVSKESHFEPILGSFSQRASGIRYWFHGHVKWKFMHMSRERDFFSA